MVLLLSGLVALSLAAVYNGNYRDITNRLNPVRGGGRTGSGLAGRHHSRGRRYVVVYESSFSGDAKSYICRPMCFYMGLHVILVFTAQLHNETLRVDSARIANFSPTVHEAFIVFPIYKCYIRS